MAAKRPNGDDAWFEAERPTHRALIVELQRLKRRAKARLGLVLIIGSLLTAALVMKVARKPRFYDARIIMAVTETHLGASQDTMGMQQLRDYILTVLLSNERLMKIVEEKELFPQRRVRGDEYALETLRDMFDVEVYQNYFLYGRSSTTEPRSVRIAVSFRHIKAAFAWEMVTALVATIVDAENQRRREEAAFAVARVKQMTERSRESVAERSARLNELLIELGRAEANEEHGRAAALGVEVAQLEHTIRRDRETVESVATLENTIGLGAAVESQQLGLDFAVADERHPFEEERSLLRLIAVALIGFLVLVPAVAIFIGAFDARVHEAEDVSRLGLPVLGHVPRFAGDDVGSLARRRGVPLLRRVVGR
jgi:hypothetical protein